MTLRTLRSCLLLIPGELIKSDNRPTLKLNENIIYAKGKSLRLGKEAGE
jgi:hypothetical protein